MENAIASKGANGKSLRIVLESIRWRLVALVGNTQSASVLNKHKIRIRALVLNRAGLYIARHAQMACIGLAAHSIQFLDRDVVALVGLHAAHSQIDNGAKNDDDGDADACALTCALHICRYSTANQDTPDMWTLSQFDEVYNRLQDSSCTLSSSNYKIIPFHLRGST